MANHKSSKKRIRQTEVKNARNKYYHKTARNAVKALRNTTEKDAAVALLPKVTAMLDKLAKTNVIHKNKAANLKAAFAFTSTRCSLPFSASNIKAILFRDGFLRVRCEIPEGTKTLRLF